MSDTCQTDLTVVEESANDTRAVEPFDEMGDLPGTFADNDQTEAFELLLEEFQEDQQDWARSNEDGWYYED